MSFFHEDLFDNRFLTHDSTVKIFPCLPIFGTVLSLKFLQPFLWWGNHQTMTRRFSLKYISYTNTVYLSNFPAVYIDLCYIPRYREHCCHTCRKQQKRRKAAITKRRRKIQQQYSNSSSLLPWNKQCIIIFLQRSLSYLNWALFLFNQIYIIQVVQLDLREAFILLDPLSQEMTLSFFMIISPMVGRYIFLCCFYFRENITKKGGGGENKY